MENIKKVEKFITPDGEEFHSKAEAEIHYERNSIPARRIVIWAYKHFNVMQSKGVSKPDEHYIYHNRDSSYQKFDLIFFQKGKALSRLSITKKEIWEVSFQDKSKSFNYSFSRAMDGSLKLTIDVPKGVYVRVD